MTDQNTRRQFLQNTGRGAAAATTLISAAAPHVHAAEDNSLRVALIGCGGRGTGAAQNALTVENGPHLIAMADVNEKKLNTSYASISGNSKLSSKVDIPQENKFIGFDGYKQAMDLLKPGDLVILATPPAFRWVHFTYAIEKGLNVFMEKPVTVDGPTSARMLELNKKAIDKNLKVAVGLMCRHCRARMELFDRIQNGEIGDVNLLRAYRMAGPTGSAAAPPHDGSESELLYQIKHFHGFLWLSGGAVSDFLIHNIDEGCWMKNDWPVKVIGSGGRHYREGFVDQNFDSYAMEYTFADGTKLMVDGRTMPGCKSEFATYAHGSKGMAIVSTSGHRPARSRIYSGHNTDKDKLVWEFPQPEEDPYQLEWNDLVQAIREDKPYNEVERGVMASAVTSMGRMAAHTGQEITLEQFMSHDHEFAPGIDQLTLDSPAPLTANADGTYSVPMPGLVKKREYL